MSKKIIYTMVGLALVFFIGSLFIFLKSSTDSKKKPRDVLDEEKSQELVIEPEFKIVNIFFFTEESRFMKPIQYKIEQPAIKQELYKKFLDLLIKGEENYITPIPDGVELRGLYFIEKKQLLVLDFNEQLISKFPGGTTMELEFIYYIVDNICYNFKEVRMVKFMVSGNECKVLSGHIDMDNPFYPDYRYLRDE